MSFDKIAATTDKKADTFGYTEEERASILQLAADAGFSWSTTSESNSINFPRLLEQLKKKEMSLFLHASTLTEYLKVKRIPRGLRSTMMPMLLHDDKIYHEKWLALCNQHSLDLMLLTIHHLYKAVTSIKEEITEIDTECKNQTAPAEYTRLHEELKNNIEKLKNQIMQNKIKKFKRDTCDYQHDRVYTWADERTKYRRMNNKKRTNKQGSEQSTTDAETSSKSDSDNNTQSQKNKPFLGGRKENNGNSDQASGTTRTTRSKYKK